MIFTGSEEGEEEREREREKARKRKARRVVEVGRVDQLLFFEDDVLVRPTSSSLALG